MGWEWETNTGGKTTVNKAIAVGHRRADKDPNSDSGIEEMEK